MNEVPSRPAVASVKDSLAISNRAFSARSTEHHDNFAAFPPKPETLAFPPMESKACPPPESIAPITKRSTNLSVCEARCTGLVRHMRCRSLSESYSLNMASPFSQADPSSNLPSPSVSHDHPQPSQHSSHCYDVPHSAPVLAHDHTITTQTPHSAPVRSLHHAHAFAYCPHNQPQSQPQTPTDSPSEMNSYPYPTRFRLTRATATTSPTTSSSSYSSPARSTGPYSSAFSAALHTSNCLACRPLLQSSLPSDSHNSAHPSPQRENHPPVAHFTSLTSGHVENEKKPSILPIPLEDTQSEPDDSYPPPMTRRLSLSIDTSIIHSRFDRERISTPQVVDVSKLARDARSSCFSVAYWRRVLSLRGEDEAIDDEWRAGGRSRWRRHEWLIVAVALLTLIFAALMISHYVHQSHQ